MPNLSERQYDEGIGGKKPLKIVLVWCVFALEFEVASIPLSPLTRLSDIIGMPVLTYRLPESEGEYIFWLDSVERPSSMPIQSRTTDYGLTSPSTKWSTSWSIA